MEPYVKFSAVCHIKLFIPFKKGKRKEKITNKDLCIAQGTLLSTL